MAIRQRTHTARENIETADIFFFFKSEDNDILSPLGMGGCGGAEERKMRRGGRRGEEEEERAIWFPLFSNLICVTVTDSLS